MVGTRRKPAPVERRRLHVKKGDKVVVRSGADRSNEPREVLQVFPETGKVLVKGVNMRWKHMRRSQQSPQGGRVQKEHAIPASKVLLYSEKAGKGVRTRRELVDGRRIRVGKACGTKFD